MTCRGASRLHGVQYLVGGVKEGQQTLLLHCLQDAMPLLERGVHACGVVRACMQYHDGTLGRILQVLEHALHRNRPNQKYVGRKAIS